MMHKIKSVESLLRVRKVVGGGCCYFFVLVLSSYRKHELLVLLESLTGKECHLGIRKMWFLANRFFV